VNFRSNCR